MRFETRHVLTFFFCTAVAVSAATASGGCASFTRNDADPGAEAGAPDFATDEGGASTISEGGGGQLPPNVDGGSCMPDATPGPGPVQRLCVHFGTDDNECDGKHDLAGFPANGTGGNGFDDNCNGLVDEGCSCPSSGTTKECWLVPASQTVLGKPVGWCASYAKGTVECTGNEFPKWSGNCRGAQPPYADDICAPGDFDCDGKEQNSKAKDCSQCEPGTVACPTTPLETKPFPDPNALPLKVDATSWFTSPADVSLATNWKWTMTGGDCDNVLPHPTFAMYAASVGTGATLGQQNDTLGSTGKERGIVVASPQAKESFYPAFSLSGDYLVKGEFDLRGQHYTCTQKIEVRAPGIRAEACWDTETQGVDLDLHMAKVDGFSCAKKGWSGQCANQDCYYASCTSGSSTNWYGAATSNTCIGWGSKASGNCLNPRLDIDTNGGGTCTAFKTDPSDPDFCGPENINVDAPADGARYAVGVKYFSGSAISRPHVNIYCNGARILSTGVNPVSGVDFPRLVTEGSDDAGDFWKVAMITAHVQTGTNGNPSVLSCDVVPTESVTPHAARDGSKSYCVDNSTMDTANAMKLLTTSGAAPTTANALCFH